MGGGDLNMKKSWHPLLMKNQEMVWLKEKEALEEKKKLDQLRKEKEEERQLQELQRLQEEQTGRKRTEKLEWMYTTPATGSSANPNDLEDYLLGKKRVDKMLTGDENEKVGAAHKNFIAVQNANTARDIAAKIRDDPLLAIKQQEQAALQALVSNPLRLKQMKERNGVKGKDKKDKKDKDKKKDKKKDRKGKHRDERDEDYDHDRDSHRRRHSPSPSRGRDWSRRRDFLSPPRRSRYDEEYGRGRSRSVEARRRSRSRDNYDDRRDASRHDNWVSPNVRRPRDRSRSRSPVRRYDARTEPRRHGSDETSSSERRRSRSRSQDLHFDPRDRKRGRSPSPAYNRRPRLTPPKAAPPPQARSNGYDASAKERAARLAAMSSNASTLTADRKERLTSLLAQEKAEFEAEEQKRAKAKGMGSFLSHEQKKVFGGVGGLEDRIKRGRGGMMVEAD